MTHPSAEQPAADRPFDDFAANSASPRSHPDESRSVLVARLARQLTRERTPRLELLAIMSLAGCAAFLASVLMLWWGGPVFERMGVRYAAAALTGYVAFILLIRLWIALERPSDGFDIDASDMTADVFESVLSSPGSRTPDSRTPREVDIPLEIESTHSSLGVDTPRGAPRSALNGNHAGTGWSLDSDELAWLMVVIACAVGGLFAIGYVIYIAPVLLAEVALDAAIISALYRRLRKDEAGHWLTTVLTRTWFPALAVVLFAALAGYGLRVIAPEARSIGAVFQAFSR